MADDKNLNAHWVKDAVTVKKKIDGVLIDEIVEITDDSEDSLIDDLARDLPQEGGALTGLGKFNPDRTEAPTRSIPQLQSSNVSTGFATFSDTKSGSDPIQDALNKSKGNADSYFKTAIRQEIKNIETTYGDLPDNWYKLRDIRDAVVASIAGKLELPEADVLSFILEEQ